MEIACGKSFIDHLNEVADESDLRKDSKGFIALGRLGNFLQMFPSSLGDFDFHVFLLHSLIEVLAVISIP